MEPLFDCALRTNSDTKWSNGSNGLSSWNPRNRSARARAARTKMTNTSICCRTSEWSLPPIITSRSSQSVRGCRSAPRRTGETVHMTELLKYAVVIERADANYSAYVPDLPGCISVGDTIEEAERNIHEA